MRYLSNPNFLSPSLFFASATPKALYYSRYLTAMESGLHSQALCFNVLSLIVKFPSGLPLICFLGSSLLHQIHSVLRPSSVSPLNFFRNLFVRRREPFLFTISSGSSSICCIDTFSFIEKSSSLNFFGNSALRCFRLSQYSLRFNFFNCKPTTSPCSHFLRSRWPNRFRHYSVLACGATVDYDASNSANASSSCRGRRKDSVGGKPPLGLSESQISRVIQIIKEDEEDMELKLNGIIPTVSVKSITGVFQVLNTQKVSGLRFFRWLQMTDSALTTSAIVCSLIIDNSGWLADWDTWLSLLKEFTMQGICLSDKAFRFLLEPGWTEASVMISVKTVVDLLDEAGGSCQNSGIFALMQMFCSFDMFDLAKFVMQITSRNESRYALLIRENCKRGLVREALDLIKEMKLFHCIPQTRIYNYVLSCMCKTNELLEAAKMLDVMREDGITLDSISYETLIYHSCMRGHLDIASQALDSMFREGVRPRRTTCAVFLKTLYGAKQHERADKYIKELCHRYKHLEFHLYSLLVGFQLKENNTMAARNTVNEMLEKGMKPNSSHYRTVLWQLESGKNKALAHDLKERYLKFVQEMMSGY